MVLNDLPRLADALPDFGDLVTALQGTEEGKREKGKGKSTEPTPDTRHPTSDTPPAVEIEGLAGPAKGFVLARLFARLERPLLVVTYQQEQAQRLWDDLMRFGVPSEKLACCRPRKASFWKAILRIFA